MEKTYITKPGRVQMAKKKAVVKVQLVVGSKVKEMIKGEGCKTAGDTLDAVNAQVAAMLKAAAGRAKANKRSTVRPQDL